MSVIGPGVLQKKSSASTMLLRLSFTSKPPLRFGSAINLTPLVSGQHEAGCADASWWVSKNPANATGSRTLLRDVLLSVTVFIVLIGLVRRDYITFLWLLASLSGQGWSYFTVP